MQVIAHRGYSSAAPENTMAAFKAAVAAGCRALELDVQLSKDGVVVVIHDEKLDRTTSGSGLVVDHTWAELKELDCGSWFDPRFSGEPMPTLDEVLQLTKEENLWLNVELKTGVIPYPGLEQKVVEAIQAHGVMEQVAVSSFNHYSLLAVKELAPQLETAILYMSGLVEPWLYAQRIGAEALHPLYYNIVPTIVQGAKEHGIKLRPFTVDDPKIAAAIIAAGVDGIITNYPERIEQLLRKTS